MKIIKYILTYIVILYILSLNLYSSNYVFVESLYIQGATFTDIAYYNSEIIAVSGYCKVDSINMTDTYSFVYVSTDKGDNWNKVWENRQQISNTSLLESISKLSFWGSNQLILFSNYGNVFKSNNDFEMFEIVFSHELQRDFCSVSSYENLNIAWAHDSSNTLYLSTEDLNSVDKIQIDSINNIRNVYFIESQIIYVLCERTNADTLELVLAQSFDSGESWKYLWMPQGIQDINFFDKNSALTFRFQKHEFNDVFNFFVNGSTDGGESWKLLYYEFFPSLPEYSFDFIDFSFGMICFNNNAGILNITQGFKIFNSLYPVGSFSLYNYGYQKLILPDTLTAFATSIFFGRVFKYEPSLSDIRIEPGESRYSSNAIKFIDNDIINLVDGIRESDIKIKIYDIRGVLIEESSAKQIDISNFAVGSYFMILYNGEKYFYDKFIK